MNFHKRELFTLHDWYSQFQTLNYKMSTHLGLHNTVLVISKLNIAYNKFVVPSVLHPSS